MACRLVPLDKNSSAIGIADVPRQSIVKAILNCIGNDIAAGPLQACCHEGLFQMQIQRHCLFS